jgi:hypothetical protein
MRRPEVMASRMPTSLNWEGNVKVLAAAVVEVAAADTSVETILEERTKDAAGSKSPASLRLWDKKDGA